MRSLIRRFRRPVSIGIAALAVSLTAWPVAAADPGPTCGLTNAELSAMRSANVVMIGEVHDNPGHHKLQACLIALLSKDAKPALVWEHITPDQSEALQAFLKQDQRTPAGLGEALGWDKTGWPSWSMFTPIADIALSRGLPMYAGNVTRGDIRAVARKGVGALAEDRRQNLGLATGLPDALQNDLLKELVASHCDLIPASAFGTMADAQRFRDAQLATVLAKARATHGAAILIAGNGHVRHDRGVPWHLKRLDRGVRIFTVSMAETGRGGSGVPTDAVLTAAAPEREDPCVAMRARFEKHRAKKKRSETPNKEPDSRAEQ